MLDRSDVANTPSAEVKVLWLVGLMLDRST
jgi:hypothetical protein